MNGKNKFSSYEIETLLVQECTERLHRLSVCNRFYLIWVPGSKGVAGNELADEHARSATASRMVGPEPAFVEGAVPKGGEGR